MPESQPPDSNQNPYAPPRSDITAPRTDDRLKPRDHASMAIGIFLCAFWPAVFGLVVGSMAGHGGMLVTFLLVTLLTVGICWSKREIYAAIGKGLIILGLLSIIPIIPMIVGTILIRVVTGNTIGEVMGIDDDAQGKPRYLSFWQSGTTTALMAACYLTVAGILGMALQKQKNTSKLEPITARSEEDGAEPQ